MNAAKFYWAIVGDASPEPVAVVEENGKRVAYTCGCADPFDLDGENSNIELVQDGAMVGGGYWRQEIIELEPPEKVTAKQHAARRKKAESRLERDRASGIHHGHRRFNP